MKKPLLILIAMVMLFSCNNTSKTDKEKLKEELKAELKEEMEKEKSQEEETQQPKTETALNAETLKTLQFNGVEPNWTLVFKEAHAEYTPMGKPMEKLFYKKNYGDRSKPELSQVITHNSDNEIEFQGTTSEGHGLNFTIKKETCSDGMSDNEYPYSIDYMIDEFGSLKGCGRVVK